MIFDMLSFLRHQHEQLLVTMKQNFDLVSNCLKDFGFKSEENSTSSNSPSPLNSPTSNPFAFDPIAARAALINSRTKSAPIIEGSGYPMGVGPNRPKNGHSFFSTSTSSLNINKGQLKYPTLSSSFHNFAPSHSYSNPDLKKDNSNEDIKSPKPLADLAPKTKVTLLTKSDMLMTQKPPSPSLLEQSKVDSPYKKRKRLEKPKAPVEDATDLYAFAERAVRERENMVEKV